MRVTLKLATSLDGRIATASGESRWITGEEARRAVHALRADHDAVLIGVETAIADDPELTVRSANYTGRQPARVVLDSRQRLSPGCKLVRTARETPTYVVSIENSNNRLTDAGVKVLTVKAVGERPDLKSALTVLEAEGITSVLVEGGGQVAASFIRCELVDAVEWFRAPVLLGGEGRPAVGSLALTELAKAPRFKRVALEAVGDDLWERYERI
ncbi:MAG: bifunctional diaminohydroxyphosphoribosylaminopyrimidine deaminase/5-amino-6-(5-phosphoribosylamino)uracil reductase RibD [Parcubacteria group bacterium]